MSACLYITANGGGICACFRYDPILARYEDIPLVENSDKRTKFCDSCVRVAAADKVV